MKLISLIFYWFDHFCIASYKNSRIPTDIGKNTYYAFILAFEFLLKQHICYILDMLSKQKEMLIC